MTAAGGKSIFELGKGLLRKSWFGTGSTEWLPENEKGPFSPTSSSILWILHRGWKLYQVQFKPSKKTDRLR